MLKKATLSVLALMTSVAALPAMSQAFWPSAWVAGACTMIQEHGEELIDDPTITDSEYYAMLSWYATNCV